MVSHYRRPWTPATQGSTSALPAFKEEGRGTGKGRGWGRGRVRGWGRRRGRRRGRGRGRAVAAQQLGLSLSSQQLEQLWSYALLIQKWNKTYNITALKSIDTILVQHIFDSLAAVSALTQTLTQGGLADCQLIDVGSGGGLPGVVFAIVVPKLKVICIDAVEKKTTFITLVASVLNLTNLKSKHIRIQDYPDNSADFIISRAFSSLADFAEWSGHCAKENGILLGMKANLQATETSELSQRTKWQIIKNQPLVVPELDAQRCLIWIKQI